MHAPNAAFELAKSLLDAQMARDATVGATTRTLTKLRQVADADWLEVALSAAQNGVTIACRAGCDFCCHEPVQVSLLEAVSIADHVLKTFSSAKRKALATRAEDYRKRSQSKPPSNPCPFLEDHKCTIYENRPLMCRGTHSIDAKVCEARLSGEKLVRPCAQVYAAECEAMMDGVSLGVPYRTTADSFELGLLAKRIAAGALEGDYVLEAFAHKPLEPIRAGEPSGISNGTPPEVAPYIQGRDAADMKRALDSVATAPPTMQKLFEVCTPLAFPTLESIDEWWSRAENAMSWLESEKVDSALAFNMLQFHTTFSMGYAGKPVRDMYGRFGKWVLDKVVSPLFPDLTAPMKAKRKPGRPRVGYLSPDMANKNGTQWCIGWLESHGPEIETFAINVAYLEDQVTQRFIRAADHYISLPIDVPRAARAIRDLDLDLLIYPEIGQNGRSVQFASMRLARKQATAWGYPATSGLPNVDYYLAGEDMLNVAAEREFTEELLKLPNSGLVLDEPHHPPGLEDIAAMPEDYFFMGQNLTKLHPKWDWLWAEISRRTGKPIIMVQHPNPGITQMTHERLVKAGANPIWLPFLSYKQYEKVLAGALVSLDTQIWSGGYTSCQAMKLGVPVVTLPGDTMRSRLSVAFLKQAGGDELIASTPEEYIEMACDVERLRGVRRGIQREAVYGDHGVGDALRAFIGGLV